MEREGGEDKILKEEGEEEEEVLVLVEEDKQGPTHEHQRITKHTCIHQDGRHHEN